MNILSFYAMILNPNFVLLNARIYGWMDGAMDGWVGDLGCFLFFVFILY